MGISPSTIPERSGSTKLQLLLNQWFLCKLHITLLIVLGSWAKRSKDRQVLKDRRCSLDSFGLKDGSATFVACTFRVWENCKVIWRSFKIGKSIDCYLDSTTLSSCAAWNLVRLEKPLDNQLLTNERLIQRIVLMLLALCFAAFLAVIGVYQFRASSPYMQDVLAIKGDSVQGHAIFLMNCAGCHGTEAAGRVGPSLREISNRKSKVSMIHQVISGQTPPMPQFQPSPQEMADLLSYLESL